MPPGVYVDSSGVIPVVPPGVDPTVVCLIGPGVGYHLYAETITFASGDSVVLTQKGINVSSIVVKGDVTDPSAPGQTLPKTFAADAPGVPADYSVTVDSTAGADKSVTTIVRTTTGTIESAHPVVTVTYQYTDADYHALQPFDDYDAITEMYGAAYNPDTGAVNSPLTLAAQFAIRNGANFIYCVATTGNGTTEQQFSEAYAKLNGNYLANIVVPVLPGVNSTTGVTSLGQLVKALVENDAADGYLRVALFGQDKAWAPTPTEVETVASTIGSSRVVLPWPNQLNVYNGISNSTMVVDGFYHAAALAGLAAANPSQMPLTRKNPVGFVGIPASLNTSLTKTIRNDLSASGVCVTEADRNGRLVVRHGVTTNYNGGVMTREFSLVRAQDALYKIIQETLDQSGLIGTPITASTALQVKSVASGGLEYAKKLGLIVDYSNLKVRQQAPPTGDPTIIEVRFAYKPSWPLNYILVSFTIDTNSSDSTLTFAESSLANAANVASASAS